MGRRRRKVEMALQRLAAKECHACDDQEALVWCRARGCWLCSECYDELVKGKIGPPVLLQSFNGHGPALTPRQAAKLSAASS